MSQKMTKDLLGQKGPVFVATAEDNKLRALRYNSGKLRMSLVPSSLFRYTAAVLTYGAIKYLPNNWRNGFKWSSIMDSLERHLQAFKDGEDIDDESGLPHLSHIACNVAFLVEHYDQELGEDDRYKRKKKPRPLRFNPPPVRQDPSGEPTEAPSART